MRPIHPCTISTAVAVTCPWVKLRVEQPGYLGVDPSLDGGGALAHGQTEAGPPVEPGDGGGDVHGASLRPGCERSVTA